MHEPERVESLFVTDKPAFTHRAYMLDVSRDRVPTMATLDWLVRVLGRLRFTELQLYIEHAFAYEGHDRVWRDASPLTAAELRALAATCATNGLELVANMNGFGHMDRWLKHDAYLPMAECPEGAPAVFGGGTMPPTCLAPTSENAAFAVGLAREMLRAVGSSRIHIGADEPFELGEGWSAPLAAEHGRDRVYLQHLNRIIEPLVADGKEVLFWGDLFRRDASLLTDLVPGAVGVVWNYEAPGPTSLSAVLPADVMDRLGLPADAHLGFEAHARLFIESGRPFWVAPGTGTWNTILGRNGNAAGNIADAVSVGAAHGAAGFLLTDWGDNGHWQPLAVSLPSMVRASAAAWNGSAVAVPAVGPAIDELLRAAPGTGHLIDGLGRIGESLGASVVNGSPVFGALVKTALPTSGQPDRVAVAAALGMLEEARYQFGSGSSRTGDNTLHAEMLAACGLARLGLERMAGREPPTAAFDTAVAQQRDAWLRSSRPGGLEDSLAKLNRPGVRG
ncbi:MAG: glycoside hydrolase [Acidimicrobiales bacterium]